MSPDKSIASSALTTNQRTSSNSNVNEPPVRPNGLVSNSVNKNDVKRAVAQNIAASSAMPPRIANSAIELHHNDADGNTEHQATSKRRPRRRRGNQHKA